jgi:hypothetical protein
VVVGAVVAVVVLELTLFGYWTYTPDDGYIHLTYIQQFARHARFLFTGDVPSYGETSPMWVLVNAPTVLLGIPPILNIKLICFASTVLAAVLLMWLADRFAGLEAGIVAGLLFLTDPWVMRWAVSGLETSFAVCAIAAAAARLVVSSLTPLIRPDLGLFGLFAIAHTLTRQRTVRQRVVDLLVLGLPLALWVPFAWREFGHPLPNTVRAKAFHAGGSWLAELVAIAGCYATEHALILAVTALLVLVQGRRLWARLTWDQRLFALLWPPALTGLYFASRAAVATRYFVPAAALAFVLAAMELGRLPPLLRRGLVGASAAASLAFSALVVSPHIRTYAEGLNRGAVVLTDRLNALARPGDLVAAGDVGFLGYYHRANYAVLDLAGLVTPEMLGSKAAQAAYLRAKKPRLALIRYDNVPVPQVGQRVPELDDATVETIEGTFSLGGAAGLRGIGTSNYVLYTLRWDAVGR